MSARHDCSPSMRAWIPFITKSAFPSLNTFTLEPWNLSPVRTLDGCTFQPEKVRVSFGVLSQDSIVLMRRPEEGKHSVTLGGATYTEKKWGKCTKPGTAHSCPLQPGHRLEPQRWENHACSLCPPEYNNTQMLRWGNKILEVGETASWPWKFLWLQATWSAPCSLSTPRGLGETLPVI